MQKLSNVGKCIAAREQTEKQTNKQTKYTQIKKQRKNDEKKTQQVAEIKNTHTKNVSDH